MRSALFEPTIWNRSFMAWLCLLLSILLLIAGLNSTSKWIMLLDFFVAGWNFSYWFLDGIYQIQRKLIYQVMELNKRAIELIKSRRESYTINEKVKKHLNS